MGLIAMSERDLQRIEILSKVIDGRMTMVSAAHVLDLSTRQVRRLLQRMCADGAASIRHKAIGRPSNNRISDGVRDYAVTLVGERYAGFGPPTLAAEADPFHEVVALAPRVPVGHVFREAAAERIGDPAFCRDLPNDLDLAMRRHQFLVRSWLLGCIRSVRVRPKRGGQLLCGIP